LWFDGSKSQHDSNRQHNQPSQNQQQAQPTQRQSLEEKVVGIESTLHIMNETIKYQGEILRVLGACLNLNIPYSNIDPTKDEFLSHEA
jgi:hypothetical protein